MEEFTNYSFPFYNPQPEELPKPTDPPPPPPIVICPQEVDHITITLEKNQQCACKDCGKLFNSVWYLKQHAVKHSNDRPFKCKYCFKTYKFRSNLYQHKCPDRQKSMLQGGRRRGLLLPNAKRQETNALLKSRIESNMQFDDLMYTSFSDNEENDVPITYGLIIHKLDENSQSDGYSSVPSPPPLEEIMIPERGESPRPLNCVRQLNDQEIETYISENKNKLHTCRKCRLLFPTEASLMRHAAAHNREDMFPYKCNNCRQVFEYERELVRHSQVHNGGGPFRCEQCCGLFRSAPALRRHHEQCRQCIVPSTQGDIMVSVHSPLDPFSFIPSDGESCEKRKSPDSGLGEDSCREDTPERQCVHLEVDPFYLFSIKERKEKDDDEDSGFRSRLNSVTQTCSPGSSSAFSSDAGSPHRKVSSHEPTEATSISSIHTGGYGSGPTYGRQLFHFEGLEGDHYAHENWNVFETSDLYSFSSSVGGSIDILSQVSTPQHRLIPSKELVMDRVVSAPSTVAESFAAADGSWQPTPPYDFHHMLDEEHQVPSWLLLQILLGNVLKEAICTLYVSTTLVVAHVIAEQPEKEAE